MADVDRERITKLICELEAMCERAKELGAELESARKTGHYWRETPTVARLFGPVNPSSRSENDPSAN